MCRTSEYNITRLDAGIHKGDMICSATAITVIVCFVCDKRRSFSIRHVILQLISFDKTGEKYFFVYSEILFNLEL